VKWCYGKRGSRQHAREDSRKGCGLQEKTRGDKSENARAIKEEQEKNSDRRRYGTRSLDVKGRELRKIDEAQTGEFERGAWKEKGRMDRLPGLQSNPEYWDGGVERGSLA